MEYASVIMVVVCVVCGVVCGQEAEFTAELTIRADTPGNTINPAIYGHFAEHLGRCVYEGIWVGEDSSIPNTRGIRNDVVEALKKMKVAVLRWPGGCFADAYHWRDGIGPRETRPKRINVTWGGVIETNDFGTHEFMDLCEMIGAEPYMAANVGCGTPSELMDWIEYMTSDSDSALANERKKNGRQEPWKVTYWGIGNESWGCGGNMTVEYYANEFRRYATFAKNFSGNRVYKIACGSGWDDYHWTEVMMEQVGNRMNGLSLHWYTLPTANWQKKGSATEFGEDQWHSAMVNTLRMEELIAGHSAIMDKHDPEKKIGLMVDEWGTWYDTEEGAGILWQQNTIRDAVVAGVNLNIFHNHCDRVRMANIAQVINVLQAVILTDEEKMVLTPTYHVFEMYKVHQGATVIPVELSETTYELGEKSVPALSASASRDAEGKIHLSIVNLDVKRSATVTMKVSGAEAKQVSGRALTAPMMNSHNTFEDPNAVIPVAFEGVTIDGDVVTLALPAKSVVVVEIE